MTANCTYHCSNCGRHFHSLAAFDGHREGDFAEPIGSEAGRRCVSAFEAIDRNGKPRLEVLTEDGVCRVGGWNANGSLRSGTGVTIWTEAGARERGKALSQRRASGQTPFPAPSGPQTQ